MPNESDYYCLTSDNPFIKNSKAKEGFFFSNFEKNIIYSISEYETRLNTWPSFTPFYNESPKSTDKNEYLDKVSEISNLIKAGEYKKVVLSKVKLIDKKDDFDLEKTFQSLCSTYPNTFVYCISSEETGTWIGASPELLLKKEKDEYRTVSLAGTKVENIAWTNKEIQEQQIVTDYVSNIIKPYSNSLSISKPYDLKAGKVIHLKSDITFSLKEDDKLWDMLEKLNPTPAVCGIPMQKAKQLITEIENHKRELYTGFIGPTGINNHNSLFVNLRNMKVCKKQLALFLGGGIMGDSNPEDEWEETENKATTLLSTL
ncbi:isochorismate synthase [Flavobacteriales bacterium]|nr:isochorismate synthase [Flavobacteriales bacterium]